MGSSNNLRNRLVLGTAMVGALVTSYGRRAYAQACATTGTGTYTCSGSGSTGVAVFGATPAGITVSTDSTFGVNNSANSALYVSNNGPITLNSVTTNGISSASRNGIYVHGGTGNVTITTSGGVSGGASGGDGIFANGATGNVTITTSGGASGGASGIDARMGGGALSVTANGGVTSGGTYGIFARNTGGTNGTNASVTVGASASVTGGIDGIHIYNAGTGVTSVKTYGNVSGTRRYGILASAYNGSSVTITTAATSHVSGGLAGIYGRNFGSGALTITASGAVSGASIGVWAVNQPRSNSTDINVTTGANAITGGATGINVLNDGTGATNITTGTGAITGNSAIGIYARNNAPAGVLTVTTGSGAVTGGQIGILARNYPNTAALTVQTNGNVTGTKLFGIRAYNGSSTTPSGTSLSITTAANTIVSGGYSGIWGSNFGSGPTTIVTNGSVNGVSKAGLYAVAGSASGALSVTTNGTVTGATNGIQTRSYGPTSTSINANAAVTGNVNGIQARTDGTSSIAINVNGAVTGTTGHGISALNGGASGGDVANISLSQSGIAQGATDGVYAYSNKNSTLNVTNAGTIRNLSQSSAALAISTKGSTSTTITNTGLVLGTVNLVDPGNHFINSGSGVWNTAGGTNNFGTDLANNAIDNQAGATIIAASAGSTTPQVTTFNGLGTFTNEGTITMQNGLAGDQTVVTGKFVGNGGRILLDTYLGADGSPSDKLVLNGGTASGNTFLYVKNTNGSGALTTADGIQVVQALNGATTTPTAFALGNSVIAGAYQYKLFYGGIGADANNQSWYLRSQIQVIPTPTPTPISTVPLYRSEVPVYLAEPELANQFGFAMVDNMQARMGEDPAATAPVAAPVQTIWCKDPKVHYRCVVSSDKAAYYKDARNKEIADYQTYGMWGRIFGEYGTQKPSGNYGLSTNNAFLNGKGPNYDYSLGGIQAGFDIIHSDHSDGSRDRAGIYLGYGLAHADVKNVYDNGKAGKVDLSGESLGAYWTHYGQAGWYVDNVLQATYFDRVHASGSNSSMTTDGWSGIASIEGGYPFKIGASGWTIEPQVQAIYQHVELGSGRDAGGHTSFGNTDDVRGRIGARLSRPLTFADGRLATIWARVNIWHDFMINRPEATFTNVNGFNPVSLNGSLGGTWGEIDAGASAQINKNWSAFGSVFYDHSIDNGRSFAVGGRAGLKWVW